MSFALQLTPKENLQFGAEPDAPPLPDAQAERLATAFTQGSWFGLLQLGATEVTTALPPLWAFWRDFAARYITALTATPEDGEIAVATPGSCGDNNEEDVEGVRFTTSESERTGQITEKMTTHLAATNPTEVYRPSGKSHQSS